MNNIGIYESISLAGAQKVTWRRTVIKIDKQKIEEKNSTTKLVSILFLLFALSPLTGHAQMEMGCGSLESGYGPYDYTNSIHKREKLPIVEKAHFTSDVENLIHGSTGANPMSDIAYTLDRFPNHHRALYAMVRYMLKEKNRPIPGHRQSPECWFDRALRLKHDDPAVFGIFGIYLHRTGNLDESLEQYNAALSLAPDSGEIHYNVGLLYFDMKNYALSREHATKAYELGFPLPGLRRKLNKVGGSTSPVR